MSQPRLFVATYHYVRDLPRSRFPRIKGMLLRDFHQQVTELPDLFEMATLNSAIEFLAGTYQPGRDLCLMTFDDGLREHYDVVTPILAEEKVQGVFFPITSCTNDRVVAPVHMNHFLLAELGIERYRPVFMEALRESGLEEYADMGVNRSAARRTYPLDTEETAEFKYLFNFVLPAVQRDTVVKRLFVEWIADECVFASELYLNWAEAREMQRAGMVIGGHSNAHSPLAKLTEAELQFDLERCRKLMNSNLEEQDLWPFSYPYGKSDSYDERVVAILRRLGFSCSLCTENGANVPGVDLFAIRRVDCKQIIPSDASKVHTSAAARTMNLGANVVRYRRDRDVAPQNVGNVGAAADTHTRRKVCIVLVDRANYGRLKPVLRAIKDRPQLQLQLIAAGTMVLERFGHPVQNVKNDGFVVDGEIYIELEGSTPATMAKSLGFAVVEFASEFQRLKPDLVVLIGDRYEALAAALAAAYMNVCIAHIQGGEVSGSIDESARHAISKFAHFHFPSTKRSASYLVRMGEAPSSILGIGCPSSDIARGLIPTITSEDINSTGSGSYVNLNEPFLLVVFHPTTTSYGGERQQVEAILEALAKLETQTILLWPNIDAGADHISKAIRMFRDRVAPRWMRTITNLSPEHYLELLSRVSCAVGNSSSFVRDAGYFGTPVVLVGDRQDGRETDEHVTHVAPVASQILRVLRKQLKHGPYESSTLYGDGLVAERIADGLLQLTPYVQKRLHYIYEEDGQHEYQGAGDHHRPGRLEGHSAEEHRAAARQATSSLHSASRVG